MNRNFFIGIVVGLFVSVLMMDVLSLRAAEKEADKEAAPHSKEVEPNTEEKVENKADEIKAENAKQDQTKKKNVASKAEEEVDITNYESIRSIDEIEEDIDETDVDQNVKIVYRTPETCKEFTLYLDSKARRIQSKERKMKAERRLLTQMKKDLESMTEKFVATENRIKKVVQYDPSNLNGNPELSKMIKLYESFTPEEAADRLKNLDLDLTLAIMKGMKPKALSQVLSAMDAKLSAALSSRIVRGF